MRQTFYCSFFVSVIVLALCGIPTGVPAQWSAVAPNLFPYWQPYSFGCMVFKDGTLCIGNQYVIVSQDSGITWTNSNLTPPLLTSALTNAVSEITFYDRTNGALVTEDAQVYVTNDAGANWKQVLLLDTSYSRAISFMGSPRDIMVGTLGTKFLYTTSDFGQTWSKSNFPMSWCHELFATSNTNAIALGSPSAPDKPFGNFYRTTDRGQTWTQQTSPIDYDTYSFAVDKCDPSTLYAPSENIVFTTDFLSKLYVSHSNGSSILVPVSGRRPYIGTSILAMPNAVYCSTNQGILRSTNRGTNWKLVGGPVVPFDSRGLAAATDNMVFAIDSTGTLWRTLDGGADSVFPGPGDAVISVPQPFTVETCTYRDTTIGFSFGFSCQNIQLTKVSLVGSKSFTLTSVPQLPKIISSGDNVNITYIHIPDQQDTCKLLLEFLIGSSVKDTTITLLGTGNPANGTVHFTSQMSPSKAKAGSQVTMQIFPDRAIQNLGLDTLSFDLQYIGDLLTLGQWRTTVGGATLSLGVPQVSGRITTLPLLLAGTNMQLDPASPPIELTFTARVTDTNSSALNLLHLQLNPGDSDYALCTLGGDIASTTFSLDSECGDPSLEKFLHTGSLQFVSDAAFPDPVTARSNFTSRITFHSPEAGLVSLHLLDALGREVQTTKVDLVSPGSGSFVIDGEKLPGGKYYYRLESPNGSQLDTHSLILLK
jgi:photosystem II stability/assembly factor-like uncharacterized protein